MAGQPGARERPHAYRSASRRWRPTATTSARSASSTSTSIRTTRRSSWSCRPAGTTSRCSRGWSRATSSRRPAPAISRSACRTCKILHDQDTTGAGEVRFWALAAGQPTRVSEESEGAGRRQPGLRSGAERRLPPPRRRRPRPACDRLGRRPEPARLDGRDRDRRAGRRHRCGRAAGARVRHRRLRGDDHGRRPRRAARRRRDDGGGPTFPPGTETLQRLVVLESLTVGRDGDDVGPGELRITATLTRSGDRRRRHAAQRRSDRDVVRRGAAAGR